MTTALEWTEKDEALGSLFKRHEDMARTKTDNRSSLESVESLIGDHLRRLREQGLLQLHVLLQDDTYVGTHLDAMGSRALGWKFVQVARSEMLAKEIRQRISFGKDLVLVGRETEVWDQWVAAALHGWKSSAHGIVNVHDVAADVTQLADTLIEMRRARHTP